ncbi:Tab2 family RNA-binding protein [Gloeobacter violaceus]|uniref:Glr4287 protein n=1 Tax=Gloeobacter violaceus (strain ATCC 29082 / PCC 7421) TaxID=251221 RepID=Q7NDE8_GLOVI|nr:Tab2 family RNA-binding protein [Gloeobacter violaceus]BAC92228.1 glr4287 [Gloeobacter violaceus PCC 7421]
MELWELDFYRCPLVGADGQVRWELLVCTAEGGLLRAQFCPADAANVVWLEAQLAELVASRGGPPLQMRAFRTAAFNLAGPACRRLGIPLRHSRRAIAVQRRRAEREESLYPQMPDYRPLPPGVPQQKAVPAPIPDARLPDRWGFSALPGAELGQLRQLPIAYLEVPLLAGIDAPVPGVFLFSRRDRDLASWLAAREPVSLQYTRAEIDGLILEAGLDERWILATFDDPGMRERGRQFAERLAGSRGLHFLAVQPAEGSPQIAGFWLLQTPNA